jgi:hypothetical protein
MVQLDVSAVSILILFALLLCLQNCIDWTSMIPIFYISYLFSVFYRAIYIATNLDSFLLDFRLALLN